jgi:hypothetical protein
MGKILIPGGQTLYTAAADLRILFQCSQKKEKKESGKLESSIS